MAQNVTPKKATTTTTAAAGRLISSRITTRVAPAAATSTTRSVRTPIRVTKAKAKAKPKPSRSNQLVGSDLAKYMLEDNHGIEHYFDSLEELLEFSACLFLPSQEKTKDAWMTEVQEQIVPD